jgi:predicted nucleic acid-binding protein
MGSSVTKAPPHVYFDSNVFIAAFEHVGAHSDHARWIMCAVQDGDIAAVTSELTLAELLVKPIERGISDLAAAYEAMIVSGPNFNVLPVGRDVLIAAARLRAQRSALRLPDAVHVATARAAACGFFVSEDRRIPMPDDIKLLGINPFTLEDILHRR